MCYGADRDAAMSDDLQYRPLGALEKGSHIFLAFSETCTEAVLLGREVGGDEGKDVQRDAIDANKRVLPLADSGKWNRQILVKLRNRVRAQTKEVSVLPLNSRVDFHNAPRGRPHTLQLLVQSKYQLRQR